LLVKDSEDGISPDGYKPVVDLDNEDVISPSVTLLKDGDRRRRRLLYYDDGPPPGEYYDNDDPTPPPTPPPTSPTKSPTDAPTATNAPTNSPTDAPTKSPTAPTAPPTPTPTCFHFGYDVQYAKYLSAPASSDDIAAMIGSLPASQQESLGAMSAAQHEQFISAPPSVQHSSAGFTLRPIPGYPADATACNPGSCTFEEATAHCDSLGSCSGVTQDDYGRYTVRAGSTLVDAVEDEMSWLKSDCGTPTTAPTAAPTDSPTDAPTDAPTAEPTIPTSAPTHVPTFLTRVAACSAAQRWSNTGVGDYICPPKIGNLAIPVHPGFYQKLDAVFNSVAFLLPHVFAGCTG
jgi:hypothetical protein